MLCDDATCLFFSIMIGGGGIHSPVMFFNLILIRRPLFYFARYLKKNVAVGECTISVDEC